MKSILKKSSVCVLMLLCTITTFAQQTVNVTSTHAPSVVLFLVPHNNPLFALGYTNDANKSILEVANGSQFHEEEFKDAKISSSQVVFKARYNAYLDEMEIKRQDDKIGYINKNLKKEKISFQTEDRTYKILETDNYSKKRVLGYFKVLKENDYVSLYRKDLKQLNIGLEKTPYMIPAPKIITEFRDTKSEFYVEFKKSGHAIKLSRTRGGVAKLFEDKRAIVKQFIKENNLKVTKEEDIIKVIDYVNSL
ncbi:hypothetical protein U8527_21200 [Kordia algicida OT-1]|uniref:Uncharacterized protein n=1 Tax=Kordia algicida OT-1 TaxID=391587 RepID=A9DLB4_9FLAO|nr:hypothetical protein [Kordia algicida]EDP98528.1 hypothetical protein KAOT1_14962 [Kordia algicida OT-1]